MLELEGKVIRILPEQTGEGKNGKWISQEFVIETKSEYPKKVAFSCFGEEKLKSLKVIKQNDDVKITFNLQSSEYNEKWYTKANVWKIERIGVIKPPIEPTMSAANVENAVENTEAAIVDDSDIPF